MRKEKKMEFSLARLNHLLKKLLQERSMFILILFSIFFLLSFASMSNDLVMTTSKMVILGITVAAVCHYSFASYHKTNSQIHTILLPTSTLEKFIALFIVNVLGIILLMFVSCFLGLLCGSFVFQDSGITLRDIVYFPFFIAEPSTESQSDYCSVIINFASTIVFLFYASLLFKEKALGLAFICIFLYHSLRDFCNNLLLTSIQNIQLNDSLIDYQIQNNFILKVIIIIGFLLLTYLRMKEEEAS